MLEILLNSEAIKLHCSSDRHQAATDGSKLLFLHEVKVGEKSLNWCRDHDRQKFA